MFSNISCEDSYQSNILIVPGSFGVHIPFNCFHLKEKLAKFINFQPM